MSVAPASTRLTVEQFSERHVDAPLCELERGEVIELSPGGVPHSFLCARIAMLLGIWAERTGLGRVLGNELGIVTRRNPDSVRGADVAYVSYLRLPLSEQPEGYCPVPPELIVEVIGKGQGWKKLVEKAGEYLNMGVDRVWVLDPKTRSVHVFRADAGPIRYSGDDKIEDQEILPGFSCIASELFEQTPR